MATLTDMPVPESALEASIGDSNSDSDGDGNEPKRNIYLTEPDDDAGQRAPVTTENRTEYSISRQLFDHIQASLDRQIQKADISVWGRIAATALYRAFIAVRASREISSHKRPDMADIRRLMFENNIATDYSETIVPNAVMSALGYGLNCALPKLTKHAHEIIMFHEGFDNAALSRSQRENPEKLDFKPNTLIGTKLGVIEWCTSKMWQRQLGALRAIRAVGVPQLDPDHEQKLADALLLFKDNALDAANPDRLQSLVAAWPLAQEIAQFVTDHTEFLMQCYLNNEIANCIKRTAAFDSCKPNVELLDKTFKGNQVIPLHPDTLVDASGLCDIVAEENRNIGSLLEIEESSEVPPDASQAAIESDKAAKKARQKEKKARSKEHKRMEKAEADSQKLAELERRQQIKKDADTARQAAIDNQLQMAKESLEAAALVQREEEELQRRQQAEVETLSLPLTPAVADTKRDMAEKKIDARLDAEENAHNTELALRVASLEAELLKAKQALAIEQATKDEELKREAEMKKAEKVASDTPKKIQILKRPVPDGALPRFPVQIAATQSSKQSSKRADASGKNASGPLKPSPKLASSDFPTLPISPEAAPKHARIVPSSVLSFSNTKITGAPPKVESKVEFPKLDSAVNAPSSGTGSQTASVSRKDKMAKDTRAPPRAANVPKSGGGKKTQTTGNAGLSSAPPNQQTRRPEAAEPRPSDAAEQKPKDIKGRLDKPWRGALSVNTNVAANVDSKSPSVLVSETSPLEVPKTRNAEGEMQRRNSIQFIRTRTDSRASMLQSPLAPTGQLPLSPVTGDNSPSTSIPAESAKAIHKQTKPDTATPAVSGGVKGPLSMTTWDFISGSAPQSASASGLGHAHPAPVFMSDEEVVTDRSKLEAQEKQAVVQNQYSAPKAAAKKTASPAVEKATPANVPQYSAPKAAAKKTASPAVKKATPANVPQYSAPKAAAKKTASPAVKKAAPAAVPPQAQVKVAGIVHKPRFSSNDDRSTSRASRLAADSKEILGSTQGKHNGGEIVTLKFQKAHAVGGGIGRIQFVLPANRGDRNRSKSISIPVEDSDEEDFDEDCDEEDEGNYKGELTSRSKRRSLSVSKSWKLRVPALDLA